MNKENLDYIKYKFHDKNSGFYSSQYEILRDNDKSIILRLDINVLQKDFEELITELYERHLYISLLLQSWFFLFYDWSRKLTSFSNTNKDIYLLN